jgi:hypothetical protein
MKQMHHKARRPQVGKYTPDNFALVPASLLPFRDQWERLATGLPVGAMLMIVPDGASRFCKLLEAVSPALHARGRHITTLTLDTLR